MQPTPPHDENTRGVTHCKQLPIGHLTWHRGRVGWPRSLYAIIGQGRVDPTLPTPIKTTKKEHKRGGKKKPC